MTTFVMLSIILCGMLAYFWLPVTDIPPIETPHIGVFTQYPGASPETVLHQITIPLEKELTYVKGVHEVTSSSSQGHSSVILTFDMNKDMNQALADVQVALHRADDFLPKDLEHKPMCLLKETDQEPIMEVALTSKETTIGELRQLATSYILPRLERIEGVAGVEVFGSEKAIWLRLNPELMAARHVGFNEVIDAVKLNTAQEPLGTIKTGTNYLSIEWHNSILTAKEIGNIRIGKGDLLVRDIGEVSEVDPEAAESRFVTREEASPSLTLSIDKICNANTVTISKEVNDVLDQVKGELPPTVSLTVWFDKATWISSALGDVQWSLALAFFLVITIIYCSLKRLTDALVTAISLPLSLLGTLAIMYCMHFSIDLLSLLALTLSCGFVVDDAIVIIENIARHREQGCGSFEASMKGSKQICFTILAMTLSLVAVFIPLLFMPGISGKLFREFSWTLAIAILVSGFVSLTIVPMLCSRLTRPGNGLGLGNGLGMRLYARTLRYVLRYPKTVVGCSLLSLACSIVLFLRLPVNLVPLEDRGFLFLFVDIPKTTSQSNEKGLFLEKLLKENPYIDNFFSVCHQDYIIFSIRLVAKKNRPPQSQVIDELQKQFTALPGIRASIFPRQLINLDMDFGSQGDYALTCRGANFEIVEQAAAHMAKSLEQKNVVRYANYRSYKDDPALRMHIDEKRAHHFGFEKREIQSLLQQAFGEESVGYIQHDAFRENIFVELLPQYRSMMGSLGKLYLTSPTGDAIPFKAIASWEEKLGVSHLKRCDGLPSVNVHFSLPKNIPANVGLDRVQKEATKLLPESVSAQLTGAAKTVAAAMGNTIFLLLAAVVVMYIILGILYESFILPLTILSSIPFACLGGVLTLLLSHEPLSIFSAVGFLLLIGIVKKNGIMMVDCALDLQKSGLPPHEAIYEACQVRFRPIMMTTVAAIMGAVPLAIGIGENGEMLRGLGLVIVGGLIFSQILTLYFTPVLYVLFSKLQKACHFCETFGPSEETISAIHQLENGEDIEHHASPKAFWDSLHRETNDGSPSNAIRK